MARTLKTIETHAGSVYSKRVDSMGREYVHKEGEGIKGYMSGKGRASWAAAKSHTTAAEIKRGTVSEDDLDRTDMSAPYNVTSYVPSEAFERGSTERERSNEANRFFGFLTAPDTPDDRVEAMKAYDEMVRKLANANNRDEEREIKEQYNIGGS